MSLYNMIFGRNAQSDLLLAVIGLKQVDVERFRDVHLEDDGKIIAIYTRTGGYNREDYPQVALYRSPLFRSTEDDDFDSTYATFYFNTPPEFVSDVVALSDPLANGIRPEFGQHLLRTLRREPTEADLSSAAYEREREALARLSHFMANGHTFVPQSDAAMEGALKLAEANGGSLRSCWGIMPLCIEVRRDFYPWPKAKDERDRGALTRVEVRYDYGWNIDVDYWRHCQERFSEAYPLTMAAIEKAVDARLARAAR